MSDGPYREQSSIVRLDGKTAIVLAGEPLPPSLRIEVVDYSDGGTVVRVNASSSRFELLDNGATRPAMVILGAIAFAAVVLSPLAAVLVAVFCAYLVVASRRPAALALELELGAEGVRTLCGDREQTILLDEIGDFCVRPPSLRIEPRMLREDALAFKNDWDSDPAVALTMEEVEWIAGRLNRALARVKR